MKELNIRTCKDCGLIFRTPGQAQLCHSCRERHKKEALKAEAEFVKKVPVKARKAKKPRLSIAAVTHIENVYNRVHGTHLHYGDIVHIIESTKSNCCVCCGAVIPEGRMVCPICESGGRK